MLTALLALPAMAVEVTVAGEPVSLPAPEGFEEASRVSETVRQVAETITPPSNRLLAAFLSQEDLARIRSGGSPSWRRYMLVQVSRASESVPVSRAEFAELRSRIRAEQDMFLKESEVQSTDMIDRARRQQGKSEGVRVESMLPVGIISEGEDYIAMATLTTYVQQRASVTQSNVVATGTSIIRLDEAIMLAYVHSSYKSEADLDWTRQMSSDWTQRLLKVNTRRIEETGPLPGGSLTAVLAAAGIAVLVACMLMLRHRRARKGS